MREDLRSRLRKLGVVKGVRELKDLPSRRSLAIEDLVSGRFHTTSHGQCFVAEEAYPLDHVHGDLALSSFPRISSEIVAEVGQDDMLADVDLRRTCFLDTETTGLSSGAGTMAFVVGLGFFIEEGFQVHQYFLRDPGDEPAMIEALLDRLPKFEALISFNGRAFDVPILRNRFILARVPPPMSDIPHLDLLHPARRLWRYRLSSCGLTSLEGNVLGVRREQTDVSSGLIPYLYRDYLRTGDAHDMKRVLYHNKIDILSMVTLTACLCRAFGDPWGEVDREGHGGLSGAELYGLGRWYTDEERVNDAERAYRAALQSCSGQTRGVEVPPDLRVKVLQGLAYLLKRDHRRDEAFAYWQQLALETLHDRANHVLAYVELAKYFEWHVEHLRQATAWTQAAIEKVESGTSGVRREDTLAKLRHRLARLKRKMSR